MFHVEKMSAEDFPFAVNLANSMDWNMAQEDFEFMLELEPYGCLVLFDESIRVGVATSVSFGKVGWFGNLVIKEPYRGKGAGTFLVKHAVDFLRKEGVETIGLYAYKNLVGFYQKLGFRPDGDFSVLQAKNIGYQTEGAPEKAENINVRSLIEFDRECFGWDRKKLLQPLFQGKGNLCYTSSDSDGIVGFIGAKVYEEMAEVGPLVCRPRRGDVAVTLLKTILSKLQKLEVHVSVPAEESALLNTLHEAGFAENFRVTRMFLGPAIHSTCIYAAESLERG